MTETTKPKRKTFNIEVTDKNAVYLNNTRITDRSTKWGTHTTVCSIRTTSRNITKVLTKHGYTDLPLDREYMQQIGVE